MQDAMAKGINDAIVDFLRRPVTSVLGGEEDESVVDARRTVTGWIVGVAQDPNSRGFLVEKLEVALDGVGARIQEAHVQLAPSILRYKRSERPRRAASDRPHLAAGDPPQLGLWHPNTSRRLVLTTPKSVLHDILQQRS